MFHHFPLYDEMLRYIELCKSVISQIERNLRQKFSNSV